MTTHIKGHTIESAWNTAAYILGSKMEEMKYQPGNPYRTYTGEKGWLSILSKERYEVNLNSGDTVIIWIK